MTNTTITTEIPKAAGRKSPLSICCAICQKQIEYIEVHRNFESNSFTIKVKCHGEEETRNLSDEFLQDTGGMAGKVGYAFDGPKPTLIQKP